MFYRRVGLFHPSTVFLGIWLANFSFYALEGRFDMFHYELTPYAQWLFIASFITFFLGMLIVPMAPPGTKNKKSMAISDGQISFLYRTAKYLLVFYAFAVGFKYVILVAKYGNPFASLSQVRYDAWNKIIIYPEYLYLLTLPAYLMVLNLGILLALKKSKKVILLVAAALALAFLNDCTIGMRGGMTNFSLLLACSYFMTYVSLGKKVTLKHVAELSLLAVGLLLVLTAMLYMRTDKSVSFGSRFVKDTYLYFVGTIPACGYFFEHPWGSSAPAIWTFGGIYKAADVLLGAAGIPYSPTGLETHYAAITRVGPFNCSSHLTYYYSDFGEIGVIIVPYLLGFISSYLFLKALYYKRILHIQLASLLLATLIFSVRGIYTNGVFFWVVVILVVAQHLFFKHGTWTASGVSVEANGD